MRLNGHYFTDPNENPAEGPWTREQLEQMNAAFAVALNRAFSAGAENPASAANQVKLPATPGPRWSTPLTREIREGLWRSSAASALVFVAR
jgi:hypothetical protein